MPPFRFYDRRHTASTRAANPGAGLADLMAHLGHASVRAAMIYQHATAEQQRKISTGISAAAVEIRSRQRCSGVNLAQQGAEWSRQQRTPGPLAWGFRVERVTRIELAL